MEYIIKISKSIKNYFYSKISSAFMFIGEIAVVNSCTLFFYEEEIPIELQKNHPFK